MQISISIFFAHITQANNIIYDKKNMVRLTNRFVNILFFPEERNVFFPTLISRKLLDKFPFFFIEVSHLNFQQAEKKTKQKKKKKKSPRFIVIVFFSDCYIFGLEMNCFCHQQYHHHRQFSGVCVCVMCVKKKFSTNKMKANLWMFSLEHTTKWL